MSQMCPQCGRDNRDGAKYCTACGEELRGLLGQGTVLQNRYRMDRVLAAGGFGAVYLTWDVRLKRACVVKHMLIPADASQEEEIDDLKRTFEREADSLVSLNQPGHPNIPEIYDSFSEPSGNYLVMKYIEGENLEDRLARLGGRLPWREAVEFVIQVCDALAYMHSRQPDPVLHRDIKPANILVDATGRVWLVDFGLSKAQPKTGGAPGKTTAAGTEGYTPLEQWARKAAPASDIYALGATLHHLVTGLDPRAPFQGIVNAQMIKKYHGQFVSIRKVDASLPTALEQAIAQAVQTDPTRRPGAPQWKQMLEHLVRPVAAAQPFTWKDKTVVSHKPEDLVPAADRFWDEARGYLYGGQFEKWFAELNRHDLVAKLKAITGQESNRDIGLEEFLRSLNPNLPLPQVSVSPGSVDFGLRDPSAESLPSAKVQIRNHGRGCLYGTLESKSPWLYIPQQDFALAPGETLALNIEVELDQLAWARRFMGQLLIDSNAGQTHVDFSLRTPSPLLSRQGLIELLGFADGLAGGVWGAILGAPLWVAIWLLALGALFYLGEDEAKFRELLLGLTVLNALTGLISGISALGPGNQYWGMLLTRLWEGENVGHGPLML